jgi:hypothetical protein
MINFFEKEYLPIMTTFKQYRENAGLSVSEIARLANVDYKTAKKADKNQMISRLKAIALVRVLNQYLNLDLSVDDIEGLTTN